MTQDQQAPLYTRQGYPPGVPCWIDTSQPDPSAARRFYGGLFGWEFEDRMPPDAPSRYFVGRLDGHDVAAIASQLQGREDAVWNTYVAVASADETVARARDAGGRVLMQPFDVQDAGRMAVLADPGGALFCVWQAAAHHGAELVNAPGTWNWSDLYTPDVERAKAFYAAVFGWETSDVDFGGGVAGTMFRLPSYGDALEALDPGVRERHAEAGAPEGFTDAVAWLMHDERPARWSLTFSVDDTDATVSKAYHLGAEVIVPPYDAGPVRVAGLRDPQGAVFAVSRYSPE